MTKLFINQSSSFARRDVLFFFNDTATTEIYTLSLHDALPISYSSPHAFLGGGFVDVFTPDGVLVKRLVRRGFLNQPWGVALAPSGFGPLAGDLLVGNHGNGRINAYDPVTGRFAGT